MDSPSDKRPVTSPFDPFLLPFLEHVAALSHGYSPVADDHTIAAALDWEPEFVSAVYSSARGHGMLEPFRSKQARGRPRWRLSPEGANWVLTHRTARPRGPSASTEPGQRDQ